MRLSAYDQFTEDIARHEMRVFVDDGLRRHLRFARPSTFCMSFDLVTWPGHLCYTGDMGTFVFTRLPDMFKFFRGCVSPNIDQQYWAEKCIAADKTDGLREYSEDRFREAVKADYDTFVEAESLQDETAATLWQDITDQVLTHAETRHDAVHAAMDFRWSDSRRSRNRVVFPDFWEHRLDAFTPRFVWCCYALRWAVAQYDAAKTAEAAKSVENASVSPLTQPDDPQDSKASPSVADRQVVSE